MSALVFFGDPILKTMFLTVPDPSMNRTLAFTRSLLFSGAALWGATSILAAASAAGNWPAWRGPQFTGVAPAANPPVEWSEENNVRWKVKTPGKGTATPIIWGNQVFILAAIPVEGSAAPAPQPPPQQRPGPGGRGPGRGGFGGATPTEAQQFVVLSYDRANGRELWRKVVREQIPHAGHHRDHGHASASPVTDGEVLIAHFGSFGTYGLSLQGELLWATDLGDMQTRSSFGEGSSPALDGERIFVLWDHEGDDFIVALDRKSGKELWRTARDEPTGWCTPLVVEHGSRKEVIVNGTNRIRSYDAVTGKLLWECGGQTQNVIPSLVSAAGVVYAASGFRGSALQAIQLGRSGDLTGTDAVLWEHNRNTPYVPSPLLHEGLLYFFAGNNATLSVFAAKDGTADVNGEQLDGLLGVYASPIAAAGRVYLLGRNGVASVLKAGPQVEILATNRLDDGFDASPAAAGDELFLRGRESLYCLANE